MTNTPYNAEYSPFLKYKLLDMLEEMLHAYNFGHNIFITIFGNREQSCRYELYRETHLLL